MVMCSRREVHVRTNLDVDNDSRYVNSTLPMVAVRRYVNDMNSETGTLFRGRRGKLAMLRRY